jgi:hypothetical protein
LAIFQRSCACTDVWKQNGNPKAMTMQRELQRRAQSIFLIPGSGIGYWNCTLFCPG